MEHVWPISRQRAPSSAAQVRSKSSQNRSMRGRTWPEWVGQNVRTHARGHACPIPSRIWQTSVNVCASSAEIGPACQVKFVRNTSNCVPRRWEHRARFDSASGEWLAVSARNRPNLARRLAWTNFDRCRPNSARYRPNVARLPPNSGHIGAWNDTHSGDKNKEPDRPVPRRWGIPATCSEQFVHTGPPTSDEHGNLWPDLQSNLEEARSHLVRARPASSQVGLFRPSHALEGRSKNCGQLGRNRGFARRSGRTHALCVARGLANPPNHTSSRKVLALRRLCCGQHTHLTLRPTRREMQPTHNTRVPLSASPIWPRGPFKAFCLGESRSREQGSLRNSLRNSRRMLGVGRNLVPLARTLARTWPNVPPSVRQVWDRVGQSWVRGDQCLAWLGQACVALSAKSEMRHGRPHQLWRPAPGGPMAGAHGWPASN